MTTPSQARQRSNKGPRMYAWPPVVPEGEEAELEVISVTSVLSAGLPKPFLIGWAAKVAAECAWDDFDVLSLMHAKKKRRAFEDHIKQARFREMQEKAERGTIVHAAVEAYLAGTPLSSEEIEARLEAAKVDESLREDAVPMVSGVLAFLQDTEPEILWSEATVYSRKEGYAGTADIIARMHVGASRVPVVIDVKTSKRIYDEVALQLAAYARADFVGLDDGTEEALVPSGEKIEYGIVVRPDGLGRYEAATFALTDRVYELFLTALRVTQLSDEPRRARRPS